MVWEPGEGNFEMANLFEKKFFVDGDWRSEGQFSGCEIPVKRKGSPRDFYENNRNPTYKIPGC